MIRSAKIHRVVAVACRNLERSACAQAIGIAVVVVHSRRIDRVVTRAGINRDRQFLGVGRVYIQALQVERVVSTIGAERIGETLTLVRAVKHVGIRGNGVVARTRHHLIVSITSTAVNRHVVRAITRIDRGAPQRGQVKGVVARSRT